MKKFWLRFSAGLKIQRSGKLDIRPTDRRHQTMLVALLRWICNPVLILTIKTELKIGLELKTIDKLTLDYL